LNVSILGVQKEALSGGPERQVPNNREGKHWFKK